MQHIRSIITRIRETYSAIIKWFCERVRIAERLWRTKANRTIVISMTLSLLTIVVGAVITNHQLQTSPPADTDQSGTEIYEVVDANVIAQYLDKPGKVILAPIDRPEMATLPDSKTDFVLISAQTDIGAEDAARHLVERIGRERGLAGLKILLPKGSLAVPDEPPKGCGRDVILFMDDISRRSISQLKLAQTLHNTADRFADWFPDGYFCIVAIAHSSDSATLRPQLAKVFPNLQQFALHPLQGNSERQYMQALAAAFGVQATPSVINAFAEANDGTVLNAYDIVAERKEAGANALSINDADELRRRTQKQWRDVRLPKLPPQQQRVIELLSVCRSCDVPLHSWIVEQVARQQDKEISRFGGFLWHLRKGRALRNAMDQLADTYVPRTDGGVFTPHESRLNLDREELISDACLIARALVPICDERPVPKDLRDAYSALETIFYNAERYDLLLPLLLAWQRTSTSFAGNAPSVATLASAFDGEVILPAKNTTDWAILIGSVGNAYSDLTTSSMADNLYKAINCYNAALQVWTEEQFPPQWAATQHNLGNAYRDLPTGDRAENLQQAIDYYNAALRVWTEEQFPSNWAITQNNLGTVYGELPTGDRGENLQRAIDCYEAALRVRTEDDYPADWAGTTNNLGNAYRELPASDPTDQTANLERAIECYQAALGVYTEEDYPSDWALTQNNIGGAYGKLPTGDRGENLPRAIDCFETALRVYTKEDYPFYWAATQNNLGIAYSDLPTGNPAKTLQRAMDCYNAALRVWTEDKSPLNWAGTQNNLGVACLNLPTGNRGENLQRAIECFGAALRVYTEEQFPSDWAGTTKNLARAIDLLRQHMAEE